MPDAKKYKITLSKITGENESNFRKMIDALPSAVYVTDDEGRLVYFNPAAAKFSGHQPELGTDQWCVTWKLYHPDGHPMPHKESPMAVSLKEGRSIDGEEAIAERPDGKRIWFEAYPSPLYNEEGKITGGINMLIDVTERKHEEQLQDEQKKLLNLIVSGAPLEECLTALCEAVPRLNKSARASVLLVNDENECQEFKRPIAPDMLPSFREKLEGVPISEQFICTCGTAIHTGELVTCADIAHDERWDKEWRGLCIAGNIQACLSMPVRDANDKPVASFMLCFEDPGEPGEWNRRIGDFGSHIASIIIKRDQSKQDLQENETGQKGNEAERHRLVEQHRLLAQLATRTKAMTDVEEIVQLITDEARRLVGAHQAVTSLTEEYNWSQSIRAISLSDKYAEYRNYDILPDSSGIYSLVCEKNHPMRMTQQELEAHPAWRSFGEEADRHPPMRGWLVVPITGRSGQNIGLIQLSDKYEGEFLEEDEAIAVQLANVASAALENVRLYRELGESEKHFRTIVDQTTAGVVQTNANGRMTMVNERWCEMLGFSEEEMLEMNILNVTHPDSFQKTLKAVKRLEEGGQNFSIENQYYRADGSRMLASSSINALRNEEGEYQGLMAVISDITARKRMEDELWEMNLLLAALSAGEVVAFVWDIQEDLIKGNETLARLFSVEPGKIEEGLPLETFAEAIHDADRERVLKLIDEAIETGKVYVADYRIYNADGQLRWVAARGHVEYDENGNSLRFPGVLIDITERKETEEELAQVTAESERQRKLYETVFSSTPDFIYTFDLDYRVTYVNDALLQAWGCILEECIGKSLLEVGYEPWHAEMHEREIDQVVETKQPVRGEVPFQHAKLGQRMYDYIFVPVFNDNGEVEAVAGTTRDITERKQQEKQIEAMNVTLEEQLRSLVFELSKAEERERQRLAADLHDNLGQMLAVGKMKVDSLQQNSLPEQAASWVVELAALLDEAIRYSRELMSELKPPPSIDKEGLASGIRWVIDKMSRHNLEVTLEDDGQPKLLSEDVQATLRQCTKELLFNVIKHAGVNEARVTLSRLDNQIQIIVEDEGRGFDAEGNKLAPDDDGGFGLFNIHERMDLLGGSLEVRSEPGKGTRMVLRAPIETKE